MRRLSRLREWLGLDPFCCYLDIRDTARWCPSCAALLVPPKILADWSAIA